MPTSTRRRADSERVQGRTFQKNIGAANQKKLELKKTKIHGKISRLKQELQSKEGEAEQRQQVRDAAQGKLIRPTREGPIGGEQGPVEEGK